MVLRRYSTYYASFPAVYSAALQAVKEAGVEVTDAGYEDGCIEGVVNSDSLLKQRVQVRLYRSDTATMVGLESQGFVEKKKMDRLAREILGAIGERFETLDRLAAKVLAQDEPATLRKYWVIRPRP